MNVTIIDPLQGDFPEVIEEYLQRGIMKCVAFNAVGLFLLVVAWIVAVLVMVINGHLLVNFFSSEVNGPWFGSIVCAVTAAYAAFIIYLISPMVFFPLDSAERCLRGSPAPRTQEKRMLN